MIFYVTLVWFIDSSFCDKVYRNYFVLYYKYKNFSFKFDDKCLEVFISVLQQIFKCCQKLQNHNFL